MENNVDFDYINIWNFYESGIKILNVENQVIRCQHENVYCRQALLHEKPLDMHKRKAKIQFFHMDKSFRCSRTLT